MACPICNSINLNWQNGAFYCPRCRKLIPTDATPARYVSLADADAKIAAVLAEACTLCMDEPDERDVLRGLLLAALAKG